MSLHPLPTSVFVARADHPPPLSLPQDAYTIHVVGQDEFEDVQVPSEPQPSIQQRVQQLQQQASSLQAQSPTAGKK